MKLSKRKETMMEAKITISRASDDLVYLNIQDKRSGVRLIEVAMTLEEYAMTITGVANRECKVEHLLTKKALERTGKQKQVKKIVMSGDVFKEYKERIADIEKLMKTDDLKDWIVWDDGARTQQNNPLGYEITVCRYV